MHFASMSLGIFDFLIEWLTQFIMWVVGWVFDLIGMLFATIFYGIATNFLQVVDFIQKIFRKLCGMDVYWVGNEKVEGIDPLLEMFTNKSVIQVLIALSLVAVVMVVVASIIQIIRTEFSTEGSKNSKGAIFGQALKSLFMFFLVPICCIGGVGITNALLKTVDRATNPAISSSDSSENTVSIGASIFVSSVYGTNKARLAESESDLAPLIEELKKYGVTNLSITSNKEDVALAIDNAFRGLIPYTNKDAAKIFYNINDINFILFIGAGVLAAYTLLMASFGMIMRLFKGVVLFMISPPMVALMPLDGGSAFKQWRTGFLKQILSAYGTIVGLNLLFLILPVLGNINLFNPAGDPDINGVLSNNVGEINGFVQVLITLTGLFMLKDISSLISSMIGADDASAQGAGMAGKVVGTAAKIGMVAAGGAGLAMKGAGALAGAASHLSKNPNSGWAKATSAIGRQFGGIGNSMTQRAKGTAGAALNKVMETATGGASKDLFSFDTEKDYSKAAKARKDKKDAKQERIKNGEATLGDYGVGGTVGGLLGGAGGVIGGIVNAAKAARGSKKEAFTSTVSKYASKGSKVGDTVSSAINVLDSDGQYLATETSKKGLKRSTEEVAGKATKGTIESFYGQINDASITASFGGSTKQGFEARMIKVGEMLSGGNALGASDQVGEMLNILNSIADKTEDQKDLMQKLTTLQQQINNAGGDHGKLWDITDGKGKEAFKAIGDQAEKVTKEAAATLSVTSHIDINANSDINSQLENMAKEIATRTGGNLEKIKLQILNEQKKQLEKLQEEKGGKK